MKRYLCMRVVFIESMRPEAGFVEDLDRTKTIANGSDQTPF